MTTASDWPEGNTDPYESLVRDEAKADGHRYGLDVSPFKTGGPWVFLSEKELWCRDRYSHYGLFHRIVQFIFKPIIERLHDIMATVQEVLDNFNGLKTDLDNDFAKVQQEFDAVKAQLAAAGVDQASLDSLNQAITDARARVQGFDPAAAKS